MSNIIWYVPLAGLSEVRLDLESCVRRITICDMMSYGDATWLKHSGAFHLTPESRWIEHYVIYPDPGDDPGHIQCVCREVTATYVAKQLGCSLEELEAAECPEPASAAPSGDRRALKRREGF